MMPDMRALLFRCKECGWRGNESEIIRVNDPELDGNVWNVCPRCRAAEGFENLCDEPGCGRPAGCGWSGPDGYRRTCYEHMEKR